MVRALTTFTLTMLVLTACSSSPKPERDVVTPLEPHVVDIVVDTATSYLGAPYRYGGTSREGFDCSGLAWVSFDAAGIELPRRSRDQSRVGMQVNRSDLRRGDLVFFASRNGSPIDHVGIVTTVSGGRVVFVHATTRAGVRTDRLDTGYWRDRYVAGRRLALR